MIDPSVYPSFAPTLVSTSASGFILKYYNGLLPSLPSYLFISNNPAHFPSSADYPSEGPSSEPIHGSLSSLYPLQRHMIYIILEYWLYPFILMVISTSGSLLPPATFTQGSLSCRMKHFSLVLLLSVTLLYFLTSFSSKPFIFIHNLRSGT